MNSFPEIAWESSFIFLMAEAVDLDVPVGAGSSETVRAGKAAKKNESSASGGSLLRGASRSTEAHVIPAKHMSRHI